MIFGKKKTTIVWHYLAEATITTCQSSLVLHWWQFILAFTLVVVYFCHTLCKLITKELRIQGAMDYLNSEFFILEALRRFRNPVFGTHDLLRAWGKDMNTLLSKCPRFHIKLLLMTRLQSWRLRNMGCFFITISSGTTQTQTYYDPTIGLIGTI